MKIKPNIAITILCATSLFAQTESVFQDSVRPLGFDIVAPVMTAASDDASVEFQDNQLPTLLDFVRVNLSESGALQDISGVSLDPEALIMNTQSDIRTYFIRDGAAYRNTLGFTTTNLDTGVTSDPLLIFPDASARKRYYDSNTIDNAVRDDSTPVVAGDFVDIGTYDKNERIDFFLIADGADDGTRMYSTDSDNNPDGLQHLVAFAVPDSPYLLIGFEDMYRGGDQDFNDLIFAVDIGEQNVQYLANPEPSLYLMFCCVLMFIFLLKIR